MPVIIRPEGGANFKTSGYDRLSAWLTSMILLVGFVVATLFLIWLTTVIKFESNIAPEFRAADVGEDGNDEPEGFEDDQLDPGVEDFADVETPQLAEALEAVSNAVSTIRANTEQVSGDAALQGKGAGYGSRDGGPSGSGKGVPEYKRWRISYEVDNQQTYRRQLDFFGIEIGVVEPIGERIFRVRDVSSQPKAVESARNKESRSLRFSHSRARIKGWDKDICRSASVKTEGNLMVQFYNDNTRNLIAKAEDDYLRSVGRTLPEVRRTNIKIVADGSGGFAFSVESCQYL